MKDFYFAEGSIDRHDAGAVIRTLTNALVNDKDMGVTILAGYRAGQPAWLVTIGDAVLHLPRETV